MNKIISFNVNNSSKQNRTIFAITCLAITLLFLSLFIMAAPTVYGDDAEIPGTLILDKQATPNGGTDPDKNIWLWDITVSLRGLDLITTSDVVLVIDTSGSMADSNKMTYTKDAANAFVDNLLNGDGRTRIALVTFATDVTLRSDFTSDKNALHAAINGLSATGGTHIQNGIRRAHTLLDASTANNKYIVLLGDGEPTYSARTTAVTGVTYSGGRFVYDISSPSFSMTFNYGASVGSGSAYDYTSGTAGATVPGTSTPFPRDNGVPTIYEARLAKEAGVEIYSIAVVAGVNGDFVLQGCASDGSCFYKINNNSQGELAKLTGIFTEIAGKIIYAASNAVVTDPIGEHFELVGDISTNKGVAVYDDATRTITWDIGAVRGEDGLITMIYTVKIDTENTLPEKGYETNEYTYVLYNDVNGEKKEKPFPIPIVAFPQRGRITQYIYLLDDFGRPLDEQGQPALNRFFIFSYDIFDVENPNPPGNDPYVFEYGSYKVVADPFIMVNGEKYVFVQGTGANLGDPSPMTVEISADNQQARVYFAYQKPQVTVRFVDGDASKGTVDGAVGGVLSVDGVIGSPLTAPGVTAVYGYRFAGWSPSVPAVFPGVDTTYTATWAVDDDAWVTVRFVNGDTSKGTITGDLVFTGIIGASTPAIVEPIATSVPGYQFAGWDTIVPSVYPGADLTITGHWVEVKIVDPVKDIGFIGHYVFGDVVLQTSFYWQTLNVGDMIDWTAVDAAYAAWVAQGGLAHGLVCVTDPAPFAFDYGAAVGYADFTTPDQLEPHLVYYVDPGYVVGPVIEPIVSIDPMAVFAGGWFSNTGRFDYTVEFGDVIPIDWDAVYASYSFSGGKPRSDLQDVYLGLTNDKVAGWWTGGVAPQYFEGARPEIRAGEGLLDSFFLNNAGLNIIALSPVLKAGPDILPYEFSITVYHRAVETGDYLVYPGVGETYRNYDESYIEWLNNVDGFTFLNLYLAAIRTNDPVDMAIVEGYVCASVEKNDSLDKSFELTQVGEREGILALIIPKEAGHYVLTFWYNKINAADATLCLCEKCVVCGGCINDDCCDCDDCSQCTCKTVEVPNFEIGILKPKTGSTNDVYINGVLVGTMKVETKTFTFEGYKIQITLNNRGAGNDDRLTDFIWKLV